MATDPRDRSIRSLWPSPGHDIPPYRTRQFQLVGGALFFLGLGAVLGVALSPESPAQLERKVQKLEAELKVSRKDVQDLLKQQKSPVTDSSLGRGKLRPDDRKRIEQIARRYVELLKQKGSQPAAELANWFFKRWNEILDQPSADDRVGRRAATLSLLVGGMAQNLHQSDYVPWQADFLNEKWLPELHFDFDGDGLPAKRSARNPKDGFAGVSVCHIGMALNQTILDAQVLVMPDMECDRADSRMSVFLQGATLNDALNEFVAAAKREGFLVVEREEKGIRMVLLGNRPKGENP